jgi:hypothetical protein
MKLYFHTDRAKRLREGDILKNIQYPKNQHIINLIQPMLDVDFANHLTQLYNDGISYHGYNYLVNPITVQGQFSDLAAEIYFEYIRYKEFPSLPSRFQSVFGWADLEEAIIFAKDAHIFEISGDSGHFIADMQLLKLDFDPIQKEQRAIKYWSGQPLSGDLSYKPTWEYIINTPVTVVKHIA